MNENELELIRIDTLPKVEEYFTSMLPHVEAKVKEMLMVECSVDNRKDAKETRTEIRKFRDNISKALRNERDTLFAPWYEVEDRAKKVLNVLDKADAELKIRIEDVENSLKKDKETELRRYFTELVEVEHLEWLDFERLGIKVNMTESEKKYREIITTRIETIKKDVTVIADLPDSAEIMDEYKQSLNLLLAMTTVKNRKARIENERDILHGVRADIKEEKEHLSAISQAIQDDEDDYSITIPNEVETPVKTALKLVTTSFTVRGTVEQLKMLKEYINENEIEII